MQTLDTLGAGFTLASHDMDIRGFGNLVGEEQSGHIREVGIELYQQMLEEAVEAVPKEYEHKENPNHSKDEYYVCLNCYDDYAKNNCREQTITNITKLRV